MNVNNISNYGGYWFSWQSDRHRAHQYEGSRIGNPVIRRCGYWDRRTFSPASRINCWHADHLSRNGG